MQTFRMNRRRPLGVVHRWSGLTGGLSFRILLANRGDTESLKESL